MDSLYFQQDQSNDDFLSVLSKLNCIRQEIHKYLHVSELVTFQIPEKCFDLVFSEIQTIVRWNDVIDFNIEFSVDLNVFLICLVLDCLVCLVDKLT